MPNLTTPSAASVVPAMSRFRVGIMLMLSEYSRGSGPASVAAFDRRRCPRWPPTVPERPTARCSAPVCRGVQGNLGRRQCTAPNRWSGSADTVVPVAATAHSEDAARASGWVCGPDAPRTPQIISRVGTDPACSWQALTSSAHDAAPPCSGGSAAKDLTFVPKIFEPRPPGPTAPSDASTTATK